MSQLSGPEQDELVSLLNEHIDSVSQLNNAMHHAGLGRVSDYCSTDQSKPLIISEIVRKFSNQTKVIQLVKAVLNDKYGLKGNCPPIEEWLERYRGIPETDPKPTPELSENCSRFRIMHLSDFHFSFGDTQSTRRHSLPHLRGIEKILAETNPDLVVVTGDLSANGDTNSLERANNWLIGQETFEGERYGLNLHGRSKPIPLVVVAGNTDFPEKPIGGDTQSRINESLADFRELFSQAEVSPGISYLRFNQESAFFFKLTVPPDPTMKNSNSPERSRFFYSVAEVRETFRDEWRRIANFHSNACKAGINENGAQVTTSSQYLRAPKFLVTHQPLLECTDGELESIIKDFLLNLASIGIHVIFCGHQHIQTLDEKLLSQMKLKKKPIRSVLRYPLLCLGITEPPQLLVTNGKRLPLKLGPIIASIVESAKRIIAKDPTASVTDEAVISKCEELLEEMLSSQDIPLPSRMVNQLRSVLLKTNEDKDTVDEVACIQELLNGLTQKQIQKLREVSKSQPVSEFYHDFCKRNLVQCRCGSSGKVVGPSKRPRNLQIYDIHISPDHWSVRCKVFFWKVSEFRPDLHPRDFRVNR